MKENLRIVFMGSPDFAVASLRKLLEEGYNVIAVVTATDKLGGRGGKQMLQTDVKKFALAQHLPILQPEKLKAKAFIEALKALNPSIFVVVAFRMLPEVVWSIPPLGTINVHGSLLPQYRGAAPINWAIINGEKMTGVTTFKIDKEIDTGSILLQNALSIGHNDDFGSMYEKMKNLGGQTLINTMEGMLQNNITPTKQDESLVSHAPKIFHETCFINFDQAVEDVHNFIRGLSPYPCAHMIIHGIEVKIYKSEIEKIIPNVTQGTILTDKKKFIKVACLDGYLYLLDIKMEGKKRMTIQDFLNGYQWP